MREPSAQFEQAAYGWRPSRGWSWRLGDVRRRGHPTLRQAVADARHYASANGLVLGDPPREAGGVASEELEADLRAALEGLRFYANPSNHRHRGSLRRGGGAGWSSVETDGGELARGLVERLDAARAARRSAR